MCIPYKTIYGKSISGAIRIAPLALSLVFTSVGNCTVMSNADEVDHGNPGTASIRSSGLGSAGNSAEPIVVDKKFPLALGKSSIARLQAVKMSWLPVDTLQFESPGNEHAGRAHINQNHEPIHTGYLTWLVSPNGTQVLDNNTGKRSNIPTLTSSAVRPRDIVYNERLGTVWFYGETVYRYRIADHVLQRLQLAEEYFHAIRKVVVGSSGLWLATEKGVFLLDEKGATLKKISQTGADGANFINAAATDKEAWFVTAGARLLRIENRAPDQFDVAMSAKLPGVPAEIVIANQKTLWLLLSGNHGDHYKLAFVDKDLNRVDVITGKYFSLSEKDGQLMASTYSTLFRIDPSGKTITKLNLTEAGMLARAARNESVLFIGSSYAYRDNCEIVEHAQIDISKGWINALSDMIFR